MKNLYLKTLIFIFLLHGCDESNTNNIVGVEESYDLQVSFYHKELAEIMAYELDKKGIKYIRESDTDIKYLVTDSQTVTNLMYEIKMNDLPSNRSVTLTSDVTLKQFEDVLSKADIDYVVKHRKGEKWIVWSEEKESERRLLLDIVLQLDSQRLIKQING